MYIRSFPIQNKKLKKYIDCIYFVKNDSKESCNFLSFPTNNHILSIFEKSIVKHIGDYKICKQDNSSHLYAELVKPFSSPIKITYTGKINEITIYFKPLGVFYFNILKSNDLEKNIVLKKEHTIFFKNTLKLISDKEKACEIEKYLLKQFTIFDNHLITSIINKIYNNPSLKIQSICKEFNISRKTLNKIFKKHTARSPIQFKNILRFRRAIQNKNTTLTQISYNNYYFDQAHMIRDFRKFTNHSPNLFFKKTEGNISKKIKWIILKG